MITRNSHKEEMEGRKEAASPKWTWRYMVRHNSISVMLHYFAGNVYNYKPHHKQCVYRYCMIDAVDTVYRRM